MPKPQTFPIQTCVRLRGEQDSVLEQLKAILPGDDGKPVTDSTVFRWLLDDPGVMRRAERAAAKAAKKK